MPQIGVTFEIDNNGILKVTAKDQGTGRDHSIVIQPSGGLTKDEINRMVNLAEQMKDQDKKKRESVEVKNQLDSLIHTSQSTLDEHGSKVSQENREELIRALEEARHHLKNDSIEALQEAVKKLNDSIYKFSAAVQSAGAGQQQTTESTSSQNTEQSNDGQHKH